jgi:hypothetical protein
MRMRWVWLVGTIWAFAWLAASSVAAEPVVSAVWHSQEFEFEYAGGSTMYSCGGLRDVVRRILLRLGAREDLKVTVYDCEIAYVPARVRITLTSAMPANDPELLQQLTTYDARQQLIARMRGETLPTASDLERIPAVWRRISLVSDRKLRLLPSDCDLVRRMRRVVLPRLGVQVVRDQLNCFSDFGSIGRPRLTVDALIAAR